MAVDVALVCLPFFTRPVDELRGFFEAALELPLPALGMLIIVAMSSKRKSEPTKKSVKRNKSKVEDDYESDLSDDGQNNAIVTEVLLQPHEEMEMLPEPLLKTFDKEPGRLLIAGMPACGRNHTLFLTDTGCVYACGDNKSGQCGVGNTQPIISKATRLNYSGPPIIKVGCGADFSMILDIKGNLYSFGLPEYGQLGHNTDGKYFLTSTKMSFHFETSPKQIVLYVEKTKEGHVTPMEDIRIVDFACGNNHSVAIDSKNRAFSWGFGGIGRLGHAEQKDEMVPSENKCGAGCYR
ncbi:regulator of chromosome condensation [Culex quinquefasciatus]|uniref:Regulator of chromosome condensation n=1 Tax=Culex quinquefasciatus TaxID=7176 RepID=B0X6T2_CULQU|nr:regulator of chromosome condensation [Culex quinquefasciatus]|eukprot:XP_001865354.1 regulator of chromosome condensation [Culex quinquefasciatus]